MMIKNYLKIAYRNIKKNKGFSAVSILSLSFGIAATILIFLFVKHELSYDSFHNDADRIYRILTEEKNQKGEKIHIELTMLKYAPALKELPEIESACRLFSSYNNELKIQNKKFKASKIFYTDSDFFKVFNFRVLSGNVNNVFDATNTSVITKSLAQKLFGDKNPINKTIKFGEKEFNVSAVIDDVPTNSHFKFEMLVPLNSLPWLLKQPSNEVYTYFKIKRNASVKNALINSKKVCTAILKIREKSNYFANLIMQPLLEIHLYSGDTFYKIAEQGNINSIYILSTLALFILLIAILNFANIFTSKSQNRIKEIGLRKVLGGNKKNISIQFLCESIMISAISTFFSFILVLFTVNKFSALMNRNIILSSSDYFQIFMVCLVTAVFVGIVSGIYPSFYLSKLSPQNILSKNVSFGKRNKLMVGSVLVQFTIVIALIALINIFVNQVDFMKKKDLGFDKKEILVFDYYNSKNYQELKNQLLQNSNIINLTASQSVPGQVRSGQIGFIEGGASKNTTSIFENRIQDDFIKTYGMKIIKGRDFDKNLKTDEDKIIINEKAVNQLGISLENAVGSKLNYLDRPQTIIGVVKDYHFASMRTSVEPLILSRYTNRIFKISAKLKNKNITETISFIQKKLNEFSPDLTFNYFFIDESFNRMYKKEEAENTLFESSVIIAIILALLGLLALTSLTTFKRTKEITVRKVLGANVSGIIALLSKDILKLVVFSNLIAWPIAWFIGEKWLQNFAYRIEISVLTFLIAGVTTLFLAICSISFITYKAATANPIESLKYE